MNPVTYNLHLYTDINGVFHAQESQVGWGTWLAAQTALIPGGGDPGYTYLGTDVITVASPTDTSGS